MLQNNSVEKFQQNERDGEKTTKGKFRNSSSRHKIQVNYYSLLVE